MKRLVLDADALLTWFGPSGEGRRLRAEYEAGQLSVVVPPSIVPDVLGRLAARPGWTAERLERVATELLRLGLELHEPPIAAVAPWLARGLDPARAAYPALAASLDLRLATTDDELRNVAAPLVTDG